MVYSYLYSELEAPVIVRSALNGRERHEVKDLLGLTFGGKGKREQAIAQLQQAIRRNPYDAKIHEQLGMGLLLQRQQQEAIASFKRARDLFRSQGKIEEAYKLDQMLRKMGEQ